MLLLLFMWLIVLIVQRSAGDTRVIGGRLAQLGQFPHQVSLQVKGRHHCGGSLISSKFIITAAHCVVGLQQQLQQKQQQPQQVLPQLKAVIGIIDLQDTNQCKSFDIAQIFVHPQYNTQTNDYDLSVLELDKAVPLGQNYIDKIDLVEANTNYAANTMAVVSGYGAVNGHLELPRKLKYAEIQLWSRDYCNPHNIPGITDRMICAGHPSGQISSCQGDSGGPLTVGNKLFGVVSWGFGCGVHGKPAMYTYLGGLRSWIKQICGI